MSRWAFASGITAPTDVLRPGLSGEIRLDEHSGRMNTVAHVDHS
jgi:hypothetical protein